MSELLPMDESFAAKLVVKLAGELAGQSKMMACAESCTGGWLAKLCTDIAGSSNWFDRGFVTYSNQAKQQMLAVADSMLSDFGAVSEQVALAMAEGVLSHSDADISIAITGIAGPGGGTAEKPVGTVCFAVATRAAHSCVFRQQFAGDRNAVRLQSVVFALQQLLEQLRRGDELI